MIALVSVLLILDSISDFLGEKKDNNCILIIDQLEDPQNLGQIIRTCECAGVNQIILTQNKSVKISEVRESFNKIWWKV